MHQFDEQGQQYDHRVREDNVGKCKQPARMQSIQFLLAGWPDLFVKADEIGDSALPCSILYRERQYS